MHKCINRRDKLLKIAHQTRNTKLINNNSVSSYESDLYTTLWCSFSQAVQAFMLATWMTVTMDPLSPTEEKKYQDYKYFYYIPWHFVSLYTSKLINLVCCYMVDTPQWWTQIIQKYRGHSGLLNKVQNFLMFFTSLLPIVSILERFHCSDFKGVGCWGLNSIV